MPGNADNAISTLVQASTTLCQATLDRLAGGDDTVATPAEIEDVRQDLITLLGSIGKECTALSLAFKPPATMAAVEATLKKIHGSIVKLAFCLSSCPPQGALSKEIRWLGEEALEAVQRLLEGSLEGHQASSADKRKQLGERNLKTIGQIWDIVNRAQSLSTSELQALRKTWQSTLGLLDDCLDEVKEMQQQEQAGSDAEEEYSDDEEGDRDDFRPSHPLSDDEKARVAAAHMLLRLGKLLLNRLINSTAPPSTIPSFSDASTLSQVADLVGQMSESADEFALSLEPPQQDSAERVGEFEAICSRLSNSFGEAVIGVASEKKWLDMWESQFKLAGDRFRSLVK